MCLFGSFRRTRKGLIKKLANPELSPEDFLNLYQDLHDLFFNNNKKDYDEEQIERIVHAYLVSKGIERNANQEIVDRIAVKEDNVVVRELVDKMILLEDNMETLQTFVVKNVEDMKNMRNLVNKKLRVLSNMQEGKKKNKKVRSTISVE